MTIHTLVSRSTIKENALSRSREPRTPFFAACSKKISRVLIALPAPVHYLLPYQQLTSTFTGTTYATQHIITTTIPNAVGCTRSLGNDWTTNHRSSAMANDMSLLSISLSGSGEPRIFADTRGAKISTLRSIRNRAPSRLRIHPISE